MSGPLDDPSVPVPVDTEADAVSDPLSRRETEGKFDDHPGSVAASSRVAVGRASAGCPYLEVAGARWRHAAPSRDHRCTALVPPGLPGVEKQRRLCLTDDHSTCANFGAALEARRAWWGSPPDLDASRDSGRMPVANRWALPRMVPVVSAEGRSSWLRTFARGRAAGQAGLVVLLIAVFVVIAISRLPGDGGSGALLAPTSSPTPVRTASPTAVPGGSAPEATLSPVASAALTPTPPPVPTPDPTSVPTTYKVVSGDTLSAIAGRFGTTFKAIMDLNGLTSTVIRIGQALQIPAPVQRSSLPSLGPAP